MSSRKASNAADAPTDRAITPVVGITLLVVIVVAIAAVTGTLVLGLADSEEPAPNASVYLEEGSEAPTVTLVHESGETLAERTEIRGVADGGVLTDEFTASDELEVVPVDEEIRLVWEGDGRSHILHTFEVDGELLPYDPGTIEYECPFVKQNIEANGDLDMDGDKATCDVTEDVDTAKTDIDIDLADGSVLIGDIDTDGDVDVDQSMVVGSVTTDADDITITGASEIYGDVVAQTDTNIDIDGGTEVGGDVVAENGSLNLDDVTVDGHVYVDEDDFSCSGGTVIGPDRQSCGEYDLRDPEEF